jgi:F-type H+-transporting ATPase subunit alpha
MSLGHQVAVLYAGVNGLVDSVPLDRMRLWEEGFHRFLNSAYGGLLDTIERDRQISPESGAGLKTAISTYSASWQ